MDLQNNFIGSKVYGKGVVLDKIGGDILREKDNLDKFARKFWDLPNRQPGYYFARTTSINWFGFLERINECVENPDWEFVKEFVCFYCKWLKVDPQTHLELYSEFESMGYSPIFKSRYMDLLYKQKCVNKMEISNLHRKILEFIENKKSSARQMHK